MEIIFDIRVDGSPAGTIRYELRGDPSEWTGRVKVVDVADPLGAAIARRLRENVDLVPAFGGSIPERPSERLETTIGVLDRLRAEEPGFDYTARTPLPDWVPPGGPDARL